MRCTQGSQRGNEPRQRKRQPLPPTVPGVAATMEDQATRLLAELSLSIRTADAERAQARLLTLTLELPPRLLPSAISHATPPYSQAVSDAALWRRKYEEASAHVSRLQGA